MCWGIGLIGAAPTPPNPAAHQIQMRGDAMTRNTIIAALGAGLLALSINTSALAQDRYAAIVIDANSGEVLHEDQADARRFPASLTKMMTLYMLFEAIERGEIREDDVLTASELAATQPPSRLGLQQNDEITVEDAILALVVQSANDVATAIGERLGGSEARFAALMTQRARALGMSHTRFANASGLPDPNQWTTARDMATLSRALLEDFPDYYCYFQTVSFSWGDYSGRNHNHLLWEVDGVDGIKTGYTRASGFNIATSAVRYGHRLIAVVMGGESARARDAQTAYLINNAFDGFADRDTIEPTAMPVNHARAVLDGAEGAPMEGDADEQER
jgi:D-alanyl-D-alanine carboxypeptidase